MQSVREWAVFRGYAYEFVDDALVDFLPVSIRNDTRAPLLPKTDMARLGLLEDRLRHYGRAIWLDADVLVFDPAGFTMPETGGAMLCHEMWTSLSEQSELVHRRGINNALMMFERGHPLLGFLRHASIELYQHSDPERMSSLAPGTYFLSKLGHIVPLRLHTQLTCLSPLLVAAAYYDDHPEWLRAHTRQHGHRFCAANLCRSLMVAPSTQQRPRDLESIQMQTLIERLITTRGNVLFDEAQSV